MGSRQTESLSWWTQLAYFLFDSYASQRRNVQGAPGSRRALWPACLSAAPRFEVDHNPSHPQHHFIPRNPPSEIHNPTLRIRCTRPPILHPNARFQVRHQSWTPEPWTTVDCRSDRRVRRLRWNPCRPPYKHTHGTQHCGGRSHHSMCPPLRNLLTVTVLHFEELRFRERERVDMFVTLVAEHLPVDGSPCSTPRALTHARTRRPHSLIARLHSSAARRLRTPTREMQAQSFSLFCMRPRHPPSPLPIRPAHLPSTP